MKCANCTKLAMYEYVITSDFSIKYCQAHLPRFTGTKAAAGMVRPITKEEVLAKAPGIKKAKAPAVEEAPVVEEVPVIEEAPVVEEVPVAKVTSKDK